MVVVVATFALTSRAGRTVSRCLAAVFGRAADATALTVSSAPVTPITRVRPDQAEEEREPRVNEATSGYLSVGFGGCTTTEAISAAEAVASGA